MRSRSNSGVRLDGYARLVQRTILCHQVRAASPGERLGAGVGVGVGASGWRRLSAFPGLRQPGPHLQHYGLPGAACPRCERGVQVSALLGRSCHRLPVLWPVQLAQHRAVCLMCLLQVCVLRVGGTYSVVMLLLTWFPV